MYCVLHYTRMSAMCGHFVFCVYYDTRCNSCRKGPNNIIVQVIKIIHLVKYLRSCTRYSILSFEEVHLSKKMVLSTFNIKQKKDIIISFYKALNFIIQLMQDVYKILWDVLFFLCTAPFQKC